MSKRILVVEDEEDNLTLFIHILQRMLGHTVLLARDGHEAIEQAKIHNPDIILMDLTLPKLTGWEATRSLKGMAEFRSTPIIALTAHAMSGDRERALEAGCDSYFPKPIDVDTFLAFLQPYLNDQPSPPAPEPAPTPSPVIAPATDTQDQAPAGISTPVSPAADQPVQLPDSPAPSASAPSEPATTQSEPPETPNKQPEASSGKITPEPPTDNKIPISLN
jgi:two-component system, cell cycle response regulator DivK